MKKSKYLVIYIAILLLVGNLVWPGGILPSCDRQETANIQSFVDQPETSIIPANEVNDQVASSLSEESPYIYTWKASGYFVRKAKVDIRAAPSGIYEDIFYVNQTIQLVGLSGNENERILAALSLPDTSAVPLDRLDVRFVKRYRLPK